MAADEYYDAIGEVLSYVLSAEDFIVQQGRYSSGKHFVIRRDNTHLDLFAESTDRYFMLIYQFSLSRVIQNAYENENQLLRGHLEKYEIDDTKMRDENLHEIVAFERLKDVTDKEAKRLIADIKSLAIHSDCRINNLPKEDPQNPDGEEEIWDGVMVAGLLYPYEDDFSPRDYEQVAQEVISVGNQIDTAMEKLDVMEEIGFESV